MALILKSFLVLVLTSVVLLIYSSHSWHSVKIKKKLFPHSSGQTDLNELKWLKNKAQEIRKFNATNFYSNTICFLVDMKIASGKKRFFIYNLQKDSILSSSLVAHGCCNHAFLADAVFSNKINSGCSCLGKFKIGGSYMGSFGLAYKLYGLDSANSNAAKRFIVLHSYPCVPDKDIYPLGLCNSRGCAMISSKFLLQLKPYLLNTSKPILLDIFND